MLLRSSCRSSISALFCGSGCKVLRLLWGSCAEAVAVLHRRGKPVSGRLIYPRVGEAVRVATKLGDHDVVVTMLDLAKPWPELTARLRGEVFGGLAGCE